MFNLSIFIVKALIFNSKYFVVAFSKWQGLIFQFEATFCLDLPFRFIVF